MVAVQAKRTQAQLVQHKISLLLVQLAKAPLVWVQLAWFLQMALDMALVQNLILILKEMVQEEMVLEEMVLVEMVQEGMVLDLIRIREEMVQEDEAPEEMVLEDRVLVGMVLDSWDLELVLTALVLAN